MTYKIEKNVPLPPRFGATQKYPWSEMQPGDSFVVPTEGARSKMQKAVNAAGHDYCRRHRPDCRVRTRMVDGGVRAWLELR